MEFTNDNGVINLNGKRFYVRGLSWFGFETTLQCLDGLYAHPLTWYLDWMKSIGVIR